MKGLKFEVWVWGLKSLRFEVWGLKFEVWKVWGLKFEKFEVWGLKVWISNINMENWFHKHFFWFLHINESSFDDQVTYFATVTKRAEFTGALLKLMLASMA